MGVIVEAAVVVMGDPLVLDDAAQLEAELDGAERQHRAVGLESFVDDAADLLIRLVEPCVVGGLPGCPDLVDANADFRLAHQEGAPLLGAVARISRPPRRLRPADAAGHGVAEGFLPGCQGRSGGGDWPGLDGGQVFGRCGAGGSMERAFG